MWRVNGTEGVHTREQAEAAVGSCTPAWGEVFVYQHDPDSGMICFAGCRRACPPEPPGPGDWRPVNPGSSGPRGSNEASVVNQACDGNTPTETSSGEGGLICWAKCPDTECPTDGALLEPPVAMNPMGNPWTSASGQSETEIQNLCIERGVEPGEIQWARHRQTNEVCYFKCPEQEFFYCPIDGGVQSVTAPSLQACTESAEVQANGNPAECFETREEAEAVCNQFWYCPTGGDGVEGPVNYPSLEECIASRGPEATDGLCHETPEAAQEVCNQFWYCPDDGVRQTSEFFTDVGECTAAIGYQCYETQAEAAQDPNCDDCEAFMHLLPQGETPPWIPISSNDPPPQCDPNETIEFWVPPGHSDVCAYRCDCDETFICPPGYSPGPAPSPPQGCTVITGDNSENACGDQGPQCFRFECEETDICPDDDVVCSGAPYIDCKGCVAGSRIDFGESGGTISPTPADRFSGQLCNVDDGCHGGCECDRTINITGAPFIGADENELANGTPWSSQDFCKIYQAQPVPTSGHDNQFFDFDPYDENNFFEFPFGSDGEDDFICSGCGEPASRFMAGAYHIYATAGQNAGCQRIQCFQRGTHGATNNDWLQIAAGPICVGSCPRSVSVSGGQWCQNTTQCAGPAGGPDTRVSREWTGGDTCSWDERNLTGGQFTRGQRGFGTVSRSVQDSCCDGDNCGPYNNECCSSTTCTTDDSCEFECCGTVWYQHDQRPTSCDETQIFGRQIQAEWRIIDHDVSNQIWGSGRCDVSPDFEISWNRDNGEAACQHNIVAQPGQSVFLPGQHNDTVFNPCACKVERYHVTIERNGGALTFENIDGECLMRYHNDPTRNNEHADLTGQFAHSDGFFRLTEREGMNGRDLNGWEWNESECRFECAGCDDNAHCYDRPPALFDIEFLPDQRTTATYRFVGSDTCPIEEQQFAITFNDETSWVTQREIEGGAHAGLYVPSANTGMPFNYHEWIIQPVNTGRPDGNAPMVFNVRYHFQIPDGGLEPFRLVDINGRQECAVRFHNDPQRGSHFNYPSGSGIAQSDGYFVITPDPATVAGGWWNWVPGAGLGEICEFQYIYDKDREEEVGNKCSHLHRVARADISFEPDQRITATYEFRNEPGCEQMNHEFGVRFNDGSNWVPHDYNPAPNVFAGISRWAHHEFIITRAGVNASRNDFQAGSFVNHIPMQFGPGAGDRRFTVAYTWQIPDGGLETFRPTTIDGQQFCAIRVHNDPQRHDQYRDVRGNGFARSDGFFIIQEHPNNASTFWTWNPSECIFEFTGAEEIECSHANRVAQALITFEPDMRLNAAYVYNSTHSCDDEDDEITIVFNSNSAPAPTSPWTEHRVEPARQMTNYYHELIVNRIETGREDGPAGNTIFTVDFYYRGVRFSADPRFGGQCAVEWFRNPDTDGVDGFGEAWGLAGRNGHLVLEEYDGSTGYQPSNQNEWYFDQTNCRFIWNGRPAPEAGRAVHDGIGYDGRQMQKCEQKPLEAVGHIRFVPDLRVVVYNDSHVVSRLNPSIDIDGTEVGLKCAPHGRGVDFRTLAPGAWVAQEHMRDGVAIGGGMWLADNESIFFSSDIVAIDNTVFNRTFINNRHGISLYRADEHGDMVDVGNPLNELSGTLNESGHFFTMFPGNNITRGPGAPNHPYHIGVDITTSFDRTIDAYYLACVCPSLPDRFAVPGANDAMRTGDCVYYFSPETDLDICTTKRIYVTQRDCYTVAWWQVSGGNVFASQDIISRVPPNIPGNICTGAGREQYCVGTLPDGTNFYRDFYGNNFYDYLVERGLSNDGNYRCTPRIIRGRTPCKADGPSNSAGVALTTSGRVIAVDVEDFYVSTFSNPSIMAERVSERANIHALHQGPYYGNNTMNALGLQYRISDSKVGPRWGTLGISTGVNNLDQPVQGTGFNPSREDFAYFLSLAGGRGSFEANNRIITPAIGAGGVASTLYYADVVPSTDPDHPSYGRDSVCMRVIYHLPGGSAVDNMEPSVGGSGANEQGFSMIPTINYICYVTPSDMSRHILTGRDEDGNFTETIIENVLRLTPEQGWHVATETNRNNDGLAGEITQSVKVTVFVEGNLILDSIPSSNRAVTAVDIGSFLSFIVTGDIIVTQNVGVNMPNPRVLCPEGITNCAALSACWEGQSANLPGLFSVQEGGENDPDFFNSSMGIGGLARNYQHRSAVGSVEGFFLANGNFSILRFEDLTSCNASNPDPALDMTGVFTDKRFIGQGIFAAWGTSNFLRDFNQRDRGCQDDTHGVFNNRVPTDTFIYRPDIVRNIPFWMRRSHVIYRDITGGML